MIERIGPRIWDTIGPGIGGAYWDDPRKKYEGELCYSAINKACENLALTSLIQTAIFSLWGMGALWALLFLPKSWERPEFALQLILMALSGVLTFFVLKKCIAFTQLTASMAADGVCDDLYETIDDPAYDDEHDDDHDEGGFDDAAGDVEEEDSAAVPFSRADDDWSDAS